MLDDAVAEVLAGLRRRVLDPRLSATNRFATLDTARRIAFDAAHAEGDKRLSAQVNDTHGLCPSGLNQSGEL